MATQNVCSFFKYGYCKHGKFCRSFHEIRICNSEKCEVLMCTLRHPIICKFFKKYKRCKFDPCAYKHEDSDDAFEMLKKENIEINEKLTKVIEDIELISAKEKESKDIIEKLKLFENTVEKRNEKIKMLENKTKDLELKIHEQNKETDLLKKKLRVLKENESKITDLESKVEDLVKKVDMFSDKAFETTSQVQVRHMTIDEEIKCSKCDFVSRNENVLKTHVKARHSDPQKFKCKTCDFSCATKTELTTHNDIYWDSHRMCFYPEKKKYYLKDIEQMEKDGFTVKESFYNEVLKCDD